MKKPSRTPRNIPGTFKVSSERCQRLPKRGRVPPGGAPRAFQGTPEALRGTPGRPKNRPRSVPGTPPGAPSGQDLEKNSDFGPFLLHLGCQMRPKIVKKSTKKACVKCMCFEDIFSSVFHTKKHEKNIPILMQKTSKLKNGEFLKIMVLLCKNHGFRGSVFRKNEEKRIIIYAGNSVGFLT